MKIYTKKGDRGSTSLFGGKRVPKDSLRIEAYGSVDELNSVLGVARSLQPSKEIDPLLERIQDDLFVLGADLAAPLGNGRKLQRIEASHVDDLEQSIDRLESSLAPLNAFILPGGSPVAAQLHVARTVCRRAERMLVRLSKHEGVGPQCLVYLNRLSDLLFVAARYVNKIDAGEEKKWKPRT